MKNDYGSIKLSIPIKLYIKGDSKRFKESIERQISPVIEEVANGAIDDAAYEVLYTAHAIYDRIIDQYYRYKTVSYNRHGEGVGTGTGWNLYDAQRFEYKNGKIRISISGRNLSVGYKPVVTNYVVGKEEVFDYIWSGHRSSLPWLHPLPPVKIAIRYDRSYKGAKYSFNFSGQPEMYSEVMGGHLSRYFKRVYIESFMFDLRHRLQKMRVITRW